MTDEFGQDKRDEERLSRLSAPSPADETESDEVVREYERRYYGPRIADEQEESPELERRPRRETLRMEPRPRNLQRNEVVEDEKLWAAVSHGSVWMTFLGGLLTAGFGLPLIIFVPLIIYFLFRKRSDHIAFHALQAFVLQLVATVGVLAMLVVGSVVWVVGFVIAALTTVIGIGFILLPIWFIIGLVFIFLLVIAPLVAVLYGTIATVQTYNGRDYRYPYIAKWVTRQIESGFLTRA